MDRIAAASAQDRADLFRAAGAKMQPQLPPEIVEKDFWVCWSLHRLFEVMQFRPRLIFKGGTSLSKVYRVIERFSEDVDLSFSHGDLGIEGRTSPEEKDISNTEAKKRVKGLVEKCKRTVREKLLPEMQADFRTVLRDATWRIEIDDADKQALKFTYPRADTGLSAPSYLRREILFEMGARSDDWPSESSSVSPYAAEVIPDAFAKGSSCKVCALKAERTFWEKATLLHAEFHRPANAPAKTGCARHYYDLYKLWNHDIGKKALGQLDLLERVAAHKSLYFAAAWAHYESAKPGTLRLVPSQERLGALRRDYIAMRAMFFTAPPSFDEVLSGLSELESCINGKR